MPTQTRQRERPSRTMREPHRASRICAQRSPWTRPRRRHPDFPTGVNATRRTIVAHTMGKNIPPECEGPTLAITAGLAVADWYW